MTGQGHPDLLTLGKDEILLQRVNCDLRLVSVLLLNTD